MNIKSNNKKQKKLFHFFIETFPFKQEDTKPKFDLSISNIGNDSNILSNKIIKYH